MADNQRCTSRVDDGDTTKTTVQGMGAALGEVTDEDHRQPEIRRQPAKQAKRVSDGFFIFQSLGKELAERISNQQPSVDFLGSLPNHGQVLGVVQMQRFGLRVNTDLLRVTTSRLDTRLDRGPKIVFSLQQDRATADRLAIIERHGLGRRDPGSQVVG